MPVEDVLLWRMEGELMSERVVHHFYESISCAMVALETRLEPFRGH